MWPLFAVAAAIAVVSWFSKSGGPSPAPAPTPDTLPESQPTKVDGSCMADGLDPELLRGVQSALIALGFLPAGSDDGACGPKTKAAIRAYRASRSMLEGEFVSRTLINHLKIDVPCGEGKYTERLWTLLGEDRPRIWWATKPSLWGVPALEGDDRYVVVDKKSPMPGKYCAVLRVTPPTNTACPYGRIVEVIENTCDVNLRVGAYVALQRPVISTAGVTWQEVPWS